MDKMSNKLSRQRANWTVALLSVVCLCIFTYIFTQWQQNGTFLPVWDAQSQSGDEQVDGTYFTLYDQESGEAIEYMSRKVYVGDELLTGDNKHYKVTKIEGQSAYCELLEKRQMEQVLAELESVAKTVSAQPGAFQAVAIYCTHTDESYVPTSGTESKNGGGDILDVATVMATVLEDQGVTVIHSENIHDPHDVNAYQRSRKTAAELLREAPAAMIDVHRDGIPDPEYYATQFDGEAATQIRLVVGRQNQNSEANIEFAEKMKAYYDEVKPGLIKSIFMAKGNYNQDLAPHSVLLEVGTHTNSLEEAEVGAREFAEVLPQFLGIKTAAEQTQPEAAAQTQQTPAAEKDSGGTGKAIVWLVVLAAVGCLAFVWISRGTLKKN